MRLKLISCEVLFREMCDASAHSPHQVDLEFLPKGLHDLGGKPMAAKIQEVVDRTPEGVYDAILLGYALCGNGLDGLTARHTRLVLPRAHDCIALLMGSHDRYQAYFEDNPGTFYRSTGWLERGKGLQQLTHNTMGFDESLEAMIQKYGEDNGRYLYEEMTRYRSQYSKLTFIETGLEAGGKFIDEAAAEAAEKGWSFERLPGDLAWLGRLVEGEWADAEFIVAQPGQHIAASYDNRVVKVRT
jgi:Protein of unknown function (DUF1638)